MPSLSSGTHPSAATQRASTGKAEYSERGPLSLREHGGETYSGKPEHRRSTLTPHRSPRPGDNLAKEDSRSTVPQPDLETAERRVHGPPRGKKGEPHWLPPGRPD